MAVLEKRKGGGAKLSRSETVTVRLDPKLRYLAELAALKHRRTLSSFIEWAIEDTLSRTALHDSGRDEPVTLMVEAEQLWDVDEPDRFVKLALRYPELLTHEEQKRWKLIRENGYLWRGNSQNPSKKWSWAIKDSAIIYERLREHWSTFCAVARGEETSAELPTWVGKDEVASPPTIEDREILF